MDRYATNAANSPAYASDVRPPGVMEDSHNRLAGIASTLEQALNSLGSLSERMFGPIPKEVSGASPAPSKPSHADLLDSLLTRVSILASTVGDEANRLNNRI